MSQEWGNDMIKSDSKPRGGHFESPKAIEDKLNKLWDIALYRYEPAIRKEAIQTIITTETTKARIEERKKIAEEVREMANDPGLYLALQKDQKQ